MSSVVFAPLPTAVTCAVNSPIAPTFAALLPAWPSSVVNVPAAGVGQPTRHLPVMTNCRKMKRTQFLKN
jgi:hypothetical protein